MTTITVKVADAEKSKLTKFIADIGGEILSEVSASEATGVLARYKGIFSKNRHKSLKEHAVQIRNEWDRSI